jgi:hypothetical protein
MGTGDDRIQASTVTGGDTRGLSFFFTRAPVAARAVVAVASIVGVCGYRYRFNGTCEAMTVTCRRAGSIVGPIPSNKQS